MPIANAKDGCPINYQVEGPAERAGADAVQFARHQSAHVGRPGAGLVASTSVWCATTAAATASPARPRAPTRWTCSATTRSQWPTPPAQRSSTGAACRWAAWSDNGWAPTRATAWKSSSSPTRTTITPTSSPGTTASSSPATTAWKSCPARRWSAGSPRASASSSPGPVGKVGRDVHRDPARRLHRLLRGGARHGLPRLDADHHRADDGDRRQQGPGDASRSTATRSTR